MLKTERIYQLILIAFCGLWLLFKALAGPLLLLLLILGLIGKRRQENQFKLSKLTMLWMAFFVLYALSLFWAQTPDIAALERKLALLAFPLVFSFQWKKPVPIAQMWLAHTLACLVLIAIAYYDAIMCQLTLGTSVRCFSTTYFSQVHHPSYFSAFLIFSVIGLLYQKIAWFAEKPRWVSWIVIALFTFMHVHLGTLAGILALVVVFVAYIGSSLSKSWGLLKSSIAGLALFIIGVTLAFQSPEIKADALNAYGFTKKFLAKPNEFVQSRQEPLQGNELRLILWTASIQEVVAHPFGLGLGGMEPAFKDKLIKWGYPQQAKKEFNPHNQLLQVCNEIGLLGLLLFGLILFQFFRKAIFQKAKAPLLFATVFLVFCIFESMLQRASGIVFFMCWFCAFASNWYHYPSSKTT
jgi:O-antigen ligase